SAFAAALGTDHRASWISLADMEEQRDALFDAMDQPSIDGVNTFFVSLAARRAGLKAALSGLGADELFAGYPSFVQVPRLARGVRMLSRVPFGMGALALLGRGAGTIFARPKLAGLAPHAGTVAGAFFLRRAIFLPQDLPHLMG